MEVSRQAFDCKLLISDQNVGDDNHDSGFGSNTAVALTGIAVTSFPLPLVFYLQVVYRYDTDKCGFGACANVSCDGRSCACYRMTFGLSLAALGYHVRFRVFRV